MPVRPAFSSLAHDAIAQRLALRQRGGQVGRVRQGGPRAAHIVRPRALPRELLLAGPEHEQAPRPKLPRKSFTDEAPA
eukprot:5508608-Pyramimonas_sp.AAC.1